MSGPEPGSPPAHRRLSRREFLQWAAGLGGAALFGYLLRGWITPGPTELPSPTATGPVPTPTGTPTPTTAPPDTATPEPTATEEPWILPNRPSKLGLHTIKPNNAFPFVRGVTEAGAHVTLVKALGNFGLLREIKSVSPTTVTIGRWDGLANVEIQGDPAEVAGYVMAQHMAQWTNERDVADYWEVLNEVNPPTVEGHLWLARFYSAAMTIAEANGFRLALLSYSTGVPEWATWQAIVESGFFTQAKAGGHILALHEYNWPRMSSGWGVGLPGQPAPDAERGILAGRYRHLYRDFLIPRDQVIPLAITECGLDPLLAGEKVGGLPARWLRELAWYDSKLVEDDYVLGAAVFTLGGDEGWRGFDYEAQLPALHDYLVRLKDLGATSAMGQARSSRMTITPPINS